MAAGTFNVGTFTVFAGVVPPGTHALKLYLSYNPAHNVSGVTFSDNTLGTTIVTYGASFGHQFFASIDDVTVPNVKVVVNMPAGAGIVTYELVAFSSDQSVFINNDASAPVPIVPAAFQASNYVGFSLAAGGSKPLPLSTLQLLSWNFSGQAVGAYVGSITDCVGTVIDEIEMYVASLAGGIASTRSTIVFPGGGAPGLASLFFQCVQPAGGNAQAAGMAFVSP